MKFIFPYKELYCFFLPYAILSLETSRKRRPLFLNVMFVKMISELLGGFRQFLYLEMILFGKISAQPHTSLCIQFLNRENND